MWFLYAFLGAVITGVGQVLTKKGQMKLTPLLDNFLAAIIVNLLLAPLLLFWGVGLTVSKEIIFLAFIAASMYATFYYVLNKSEASLMISLINAFPVVTIFLAIVVLNELPNQYQWLGIVLVVLGTIFISQEKTTERSSKNSKAWVLWGLFGAFAIGIAEFVTKIATNSVDGFTFTFYVFLMYVPLFTIYLIFDKKGRKFYLLKNTSSLIFTIIGIFFIELGLIAISLAYQSGFASLVSPVVASQLLITVVLAMIFLKEKLLTVQKIGIILTLIGVIIIGVVA